MASDVRPKAADRTTADLAETSTGRPILDSVAFDNRHFAVAAGHMNYRRNSLLGQLFKKLVPARSFGCQLRTFSIRDNLHRQPEACTPNEMRHDHHDCHRHRCQ